MKLNNKDLQHWILPKITFTNNLLFTSNIQSIFNSKYDITGSPSSSHDGSSLIPGLSSIQKQISSISFLLHYTRHFRKHIFVFWPFCLNRKPSKSILVSISIYSQFKTSSNEKLVKDFNLGLVNLSDKFKLKQFLHCKEFFCSRLIEGRA